MFKQQSKFIVILFLTLVSGCAGTFKHALNFNPSEPIRVAVLPFGQVDDKGNFIAADSSYLIDNVGLVSSKLKEPPATYVQKLVQNELSKTSLDVVAPSLIEAQLSHNGFANKDSSFDLAKIYSMPPKELCEKILQCDAVLYGKVTKWNRTYLGLQTFNSVEMELKLVSAQDGKVLFTSTGADSDSRGISKGPTGFSSLVVEPVLGLDNSIIAELSQSVVKETLKPLFVQNRPEFLNSVPPAIYAAAHDAANDSNRGAIKRSNILTVLALGAPGHVGSFSIGNKVENIFMIEKDSGHYIGEYLPIDDESFSNQQVTVCLTDKFGRRTERRIGGNLLSLQ